jgi:O-6-methylguanine DNA methyltransferase
MEEYLLVVSEGPGDITARFTENGLRQLDLNAAPTDATGECPRNVRKQMDSLKRALDRYFAGKQEGFEEVPIDLDGATPFRRNVWETARTVRWGQISSYGDLAERMGRTKGCSRAVGQALGSNPIAIVIPCHRFLASDGSLGGFACGLDWKRTLLRLEGTGE